MRLSVKLVLLAFLFAASAHAQSQSSSANWQQLGQMLFEDQSLSHDGKIACASCHLINYALADHRAKPTGRDEVMITRNAPSLLGLLNNQPLFWDGRRQQLMDAVLDPFFSEHEHALTADSLLEKVSGNSDYYRYFNQLQSDQPISTSVIAQTISTYLTSLPANTSDFDRWQQSPDTFELNADAQLGYELFTGRAGCVRCHVINDEHTRFTDDQYHQHGVSAQYLQSELPALLIQVNAMNQATLDAQRQINPQVAALGRFLVTGKPADIGAFRTPSLRNVMRTGPYMHDGSVVSIDAVIDRELYYSAADQGASFSQQERYALKQFLTLLNDQPLGAPVVDSNDNL